MPTYPADHAGPIDMPPKDPDAVIDYQIDWSDWLASSEVISTSVWIVSTGIVKDSDTNTTTTTTIWLSGGAAELSYTLTNRITTNSARTEDRTMRISIIDK